MLILILCKTGCMCWCGCYVKLDVVSGNEAMSNWMWVLELMRCII